MLRSLDEYGRTYNMLRSLDEYGKTYNMLRLLDEYGRITWATHIKQLLFQFWFWICMASK